MDRPRRIVLSATLASQAMTEARQNLCQQVKSHRGRGADEAQAHRMLLRRAGDTLSDTAAQRPAGVSTPATRPARSRPCEGQRTLSVLLRTLPHEPWGAGLTPGRSKQPLPLAGRR